MVISTDPLWGEWDEAFFKTFDDAVVYGDYDQEQVLHEGTIRILVNGWVELPTGRMLSPTAIHHIDRAPNGNG